MSVVARLVTPAKRFDRPLDLQVRREAEVSGCGTYRWWLRRYWSAAPASKLAILPWIMLNPSMADARADDPTLRRIIAFSWRWGFDGLVVVNLFPYRSPKPADLRDWMRWDQRQDWCARDRMWENWDRCAALLESFDAAMAAWGSPPGLFGYETELAAEQLLNAINDPERVAPPATRKRVIELFCLGNNGVPTHPMARGRHRLSNDTEPGPIRRYPGTIKSAPFEACP